MTENQRVRKDATSCLVPKSYERNTIDYVNDFTFKLWLLFEYILFLISASIQIGRGVSEQVVHFFGDH